MDLIESPQTVTIASTTNEQTLIEIAPPENTTRWIASLFWFTTNLTAATTFRMYLWNVDAAAYELIDGVGGIFGTLVWDPNTSTGRCVRFIASMILTAGSKLKLTVQSSQAEGAAKDVYVSYGYLA